MASAAALPILAACSAAPAAPTASAAAPATAAPVATQAASTPQTVEKVVTQIVEKQVVSTVVVTAVPAPKGPVTVEFLYSGADDATGPSNKWIHDRIDAFQKENATIKVKQTDMPWVGQREVLITRLVSGDSPDLAILHSNHAAEIGAGMGGLAPMEDLADWQKYSDIFVPARLDTTKVSGKHYGVPWFGIVFGIACHKPTFAELKLDFPKTWTQFREVAKAMIIPGKRYGYGAAMGQGLDSAYRVYPEVLVNGGRFMTDDLTKFTFNDDANQQALQLYVDMKKDGSTVPGMEAWTGQNESDTFATGLYGMAQGGPWIPLWEKDPAKLNNWELIVRPRPEKPTGSAPPMTLSDDIMLSIMRQSKAKEETFTLVQYLQNEQTATERGVRPELVALPVVKAVFSDPRWKQTWGSAAYEFELGHSAPWPYTPVLGEAQNIYALEISKAYRGDLSVKQALDEGVQKAQALLKK